MSGSFTSLAPFLSGASFGAALTAAGVYAPSVIIGQFSLQDVLMFKVLLTGVAGSIALIPLTNHLNLSNVTPRSAAPPAPYPLSLLSALLPSSLRPYSANLIGGTLLGAGMALTGSCPGTIFVQLAHRLPGSIPVAFGAVLGGVLFVASQNGSAAASASTISQENQPSTNSSAEKSNSSAKSSNSHATPPQSTSNTSPSNTPSPPLALNDILSISAPALRTLLITLSILALSVSNTIWPEPNLDDPWSPNRRALLPPLYAGVGIAAAQAVSLVLTGSALGVSTVYEQVGRWVFWVGDFVVAGARSGTSTPEKDDPKGGVKTTPSPPPMPTLRAAIFATGISTGAFLLSRLVDLPLLSAVDREGGQIGLVRAVAGGVLLTFGARVAGGCTSGHGLSGMSGLGVASWVAGVGMCVGGVGVGVWLR